MSDERIEQWIEDNTLMLGEGEPKLIKDLRDEGLDDDTIVKVLTVLSDICADCWDNSKGCQCWNDE